MRRICTILACCAVCSSNTWGQSTFKQEVSIGGSFGIGVSSVSFVPKIQQKQLPGAQIGATIRWITEKNLGLLAEINFSQQGWDEAFDNPQHAYTRRLNFIDIPFLTHIYFGSKRVRVFLNLGPKIGFLFSESTSENVIASPPQDNSSTYRTEQWELAVQNTLAWGLCGGPGIELRTGIGIFQLEGRYYYALGDLFGNRKSDYFPKSSSQVMFGKLTYLLPILK